MQNFQEWFNVESFSSHEVSKRTPRKIYPGLVVKSRPKRRVMKPDTAMDTFVREMEMLKKDLAALADKKRKDQKGASDKPKKAVKAQVDDDLKKTAKVVMSNLKNAPNYYTRHDQIDSLAGLPKTQISKKVSRQDVKQVAQDLNIDFGKVRFSQEAFRKGIESELSKGDRSARDEDEQPRPKSEKLPKQ